MRDTGFVIKLEETSCEDNDSVKKQYKIVSYTVILYLFVDSLLVTAF